MFLLLLANLLNYLFRFVSISPLYCPTSDGKADNIFITRSYDATSHFETVVDEVNDLWQRAVGTKLELKKRADEANIGE
jgi:Rab GDP dissociation inhibitor